MSQDKHKILPNSKTLEASRYKHNLLASFVERRVTSKAVEATVSIREDRVVF